MTRSPDRVALDELREAIDAAEKALADHARRKGPASALGEAGRIAHVRRAVDAADVGRGDDDAVRDAGAAHLARLFNQKGTTDDQ